MRLIPMPSCPNGTRTLITDIVASFVAIPAQNAWLAIEDRALGAPHR